MGMMPVLSQKTDIPEPMKPIYLDYNATTPIDSEVKKQMLQYIDPHFGNPSSSHLYGDQPRAAVEHSRSALAQALGCGQKEVFFTSGATESLNWAIKGTAWAARKRGHGNHIITSVVEHVVVLEVCKYLEAEAEFEVTVLGVDEFGCVRTEDVRRAIKPTTVLCSFMLANNETGAVNDLPALIKVIRSTNSKTIIHTDASQAFGKIPLNLQTLRVDMLTVAGHKIYAPKGVGCLFIRDGTPFPTPLLHGAHGQEMGQRAGTESVIHVVALATAAGIIHKKGAEEMQHFRELRDRLQNKLISFVPDAGKVVRVNGHPERRLPNTLSISFRGVPANLILDAVKDRVAASAGAACHSGAVNISYVLRAMQIPEDFAQGTLRLSVGRMTTTQDVDTAAQVIADAVANLRKNSRAKL